jgi:hypothetical protein
MAMISTNDDGSFSFYTNDGLLFSLGSDGTLTKGEAFITEDAASTAFWDVLQQTYGTWKSTPINTDV